MYEFEHRCVERSKPLHNLFCRGLILSGFCEIVRSISHLRTNSKIRQAKGDRLLSLLP